MSSRMNARVKSLIIVRTRLISEMRVTWIRKSHPHQCRACSRYFPTKVRCLEACLPMHLAKISALWVNS